jgi:hypothetical protein
MLGGIMEMVDWEIIVLEAKILQFKYVEDSLSQPFPPVRPTLWA